MLIFWTKGHFLLTNLLVDKLKKSSNARIINVSSVAHIRGEISWDDINLDKSYNKYKAYSQSKLANILFSRELANRLTDTDIKVYCLHPGLINTDLYRHLNGVMSCIFNFSSKIVNIDAELGAQTTLYCALEESISGETGRYYKWVIKSKLICENLRILVINSIIRNCRRVENMVANAVDDVSARKLWELSCKLVGIEDKYKV